MAPVCTRALVLHAFPYGETSKIVRLLTREHGSQSAIAKGAQRPKSPFGARLQVLSEGTAHIYFKPHRDLHTLAGFDVARQHEELTRDVRRFTAGAALAELLIRLCPTEPHPEIYDLSVSALAQLETVPEEALDLASLSVLWAAVEALGFAPQRDACARDGRPLPPGAAAFSVSDGGFLCANCARGSRSARLGADDREVLERLIAGSVSEIATLDAKHAAAHRRLLVRFVERHLAEDRELTALSLWRELA
jgi:DNA repair protein RecO (recombination protein O)